MADRIALQDNGFVDPDGVVWFNSPVEDNEAVKASFYKYMFEIPEGAAELVKRGIQVQMSRYTSQIMKFSLLDNKI